MQYVYSASGSAEAHMLVALLEQVGIKAFIHGDQLQGGIGELPTMDLVKIAVSDENYEQARDYILEWERGNPVQQESLQVTEQNNEGVCSGRRSMTVILVFLTIGTVLGWIANNYYHDAGLLGDSVSQSEYDINKDGKIDLKY